MIILLLPKPTLGHSTDHHKEMMRDALCGIVFGKLLFKKTLEGVLSWGLLAPLGRQWAPTGAPGSDSSARDTRLPLAMSSLVF